MPPIRISRSGVAGTLLAFAAAAVCARLGFWQLDRLDQRVARNEAVAMRLEAPALVLPIPAADTTGLLYRTVELEGEYDLERSVVLPGRAHRGAPGVHVLTPLLVEGGRSAVLVNRGWAPSADAATVDLSAFLEPRAIRLRGVVLPFPETVPVRRAGARGAAGLEGPAKLAEAGGFRRVWHRFDADALRRQFPYPVAGFYVQALPERAARVYPLRLPPPELDNGPHLSYAIQWFSFGVIALVGWGVLVAGRGAGAARKGATEAEEG